MNNPERSNNPEDEANNPWAQVFDFLNRSARHKLELEYGRRTPEKKINRFFIYDSGLKVQVASPDIDKYLQVSFSPSRNNAEAEHIRPPKGVDMAWATGEEEPMFEQVEFTVFRGRVTAYGRPVRAEEDVKLELLGSHDASRELFDYADMAINQGSKPHLFS